MYAELTSSTNLTIPTQTVNIQGNQLTISGNGVLNGNTIILNITYGMGSEALTCTSTLNRQ